MSEDDANRVPGAERDDRVDADPGEIRAEDRAPLDADVRVGRREHVPPRHARARELPELCEHGEEEWKRMNRRELVEERVDPVEDSDEHALTGLPDSLGSPGEARAAPGARRFLKGRCRDRSRRVDGALLRL